MSPVKEPTMSIILLSINSIGNPLTGADVAPEGQLVQLFAPGSEKVLAGQVEQDVASAELYVPAEHWEHWPSLSYCPATQCCTHVAEP